MNLVVNIVLDLRLTAISHIYLFCVYYITVYMFVHVMVFLYVIGMTVVLG